MSSDKNDDKFPYVFDLYFDCKNQGDCYRELQYLADNVKSQIERYEHLHRLMREHGLSVKGFSHQISL